MATLAGVAMRASVALGLPALLALLAACGSSGPKPPDVPQPLKPPAGQEPFLEYLASGVQIYECLPKQGQAGVYEWTFRAPDATLTDWSGRALGKHYAGPNVLLAPSSSQGIAFGSGPGSRAFTSPSTRLPSAASHVGPA